jgi:hypothetical protein
MAILTDEFLATLNKKVINPAFDVARENIQGVIKTIDNGSAVEPEAGFKFQWLNQKIGAGGSVINGAKTASDTTLTVDDGTNFRAGMLASIKDSDEVILVTEISGNDLTVTRGFGGTTAVAIDDDANLIIDSISREENSLGEDDNMFEPEPTFNHFQTLDTQLTFSRRALALAQHGNYNDMQVQISERVNQLTIQLNRLAIRGVRDTATIGGKVRTYAGGLTWYLNQTGALTIDNAGAVLTEDKLDDLSEQVVLRGGNTNTIAVNTKLGRKLTALMRSNFSSQRLSEYQNDKGALTQISSDLPLVGNINTIVIDTNLNNDELIMYDASKLKIVPMASGNGQNDGNWRTLDATQKGQDGESIRIVGDFGLEFKSFKTHAVRLKNIG